MEKNIGRSDKTIRILLALIGATIVMVVDLPMIFNIIIVTLATIFLLTSMIGVCPLYLPFHFSTNKKQSSEL
jgi:hypothetical protein